MRKSRADALRFTPHASDPRFLRSMSFLNHITFAESKCSKCKLHGRRCCSVPRGQEVRVTRASLCTAESGSASQEARRALHSYFTLLLHSHSLAPRCTRHSQISRLSVVH